MSRCHELVTKMADLYSKQGGIKGVVWTDFFEAFIYFGGLLAVLIAVSLSVFVSCH